MLTHKIGDMMLYSEFDGSGIIIGVDENHRGTGMILYQVKWQNGTKTYCKTAEVDYYKRTFIRKCDGKWFNEEYDK